MSGVEHKFKSNLDQEMRRFLREEQERLKPALMKVGMMIQADANDLIPRPPLKTGNLRGSWGVSVQGLPDAKGGEAGEVEQAQDEHSVRVSYNTEYAEKLHDNPSSNESAGGWRPGPASQATGEDANVGSNWLRKTEAYGEKYNDALGEFLRE